MNHHFSSFPASLTVDPPNSAAFQDSSTPGSIQKLKPRVTITLKRPSSTPSCSQPTEPPRASLLHQTTSGPSLDLETQVRQLEEEITKAKESRETIASIYRSQFSFLYDRIRALESGGTDTILWKLTSLKLVFDTAKSSARLDNAAKDPSTHYNSPVYRTHPYGYNFFVQFYPYGLDAAAGNHASIMFALFSLATMMVYWHGRFRRRFTFQSATNSTPKIRGLSPLHPPRGYPSDGLPENHFLP